MCGLELTLKLEYVGGLISEYSQGGVYSGEIKPNNPVNATSAIYVNYPVRLAKKITVFAYIDRDYAGFNGESALVLESYTNYATFELNSHAIRTSVIYGAYIAIGTS
ncbi:hypothetical protein P375_00520 [Gallibacterium genomosp. 2]|uniref:Uncharacterized protein n=1 Tax=Gallibacterium genomosp. 2 TaxID=155517 RepID=A0A0A2XQR1_9PAST|nr:hypothetical protein [Gallibacterium genomosp. 2]KGQ34661.1 hypothetical protein P375_00520 [Gallibacterium genomosp. 2]